MTEYIVGHEITTPPTYYRLHAISIYQSIYVIQTAMLTSVIRPFSIQRLVSQSSFAELSRLTLNCQNMLSGRCIVCSLLSLIFLRIVLLWWQRTKLLKRVSDLYKDLLDSALSHLFIRTSAGRCLCCRSIKPTGRF